MKISFTGIGNAKRARREETDDSLKSLKDELKKNLKQIQDLNDLSYQVCNTEMECFFKININLFKKNNR